MSYKQPTILKLFLLTFLLQLSVFLPNSFAQTFNNSIRDLADPHMVYHNGYYYFTGTTGGNVTLIKSATLDGLKTAPATVVFSAAQGGPCCNYWAPEMHRIKDKWYIYYTASNFEDWGHQRTWVIENKSKDPLKGTWVNKGEIYSPDDHVWAIDATVLKHKGDFYFIWSGHLNDADNNQQIYISAMKNPWTLKGKRVMLSEPLYDWEKIGDPDVNEGPEILKHEGKIFLTYSASGCWTPDYSLGMLTMSKKDNPLNAASWTKSTTPVFKRNDPVFAFGPGHNAFFKSPDGTENWLIYHATTVPSGGCDGTRTTRAQKVNWNADGSPDFGVPVKSGITITAPSGEVHAPVSTFPNGAYRFVAKHSGHVLDVAGCNPGLGATIGQWFWIGGDCQRWDIQATGDGFYSITSQQGGLAMEVGSCSLENAARVNQWSPNGAPCQQWKIEALEEGYYKITNRNSGKALEIEGCSPNLGAQLQQYEWNGADCQRWKLEPLTETVKPGIYKVSAKHSGKVLEVAGGSTENGANVQQYEWNGTDGQKWSVEATTDGYYKLVSMGSEQVMDVAWCTWDNGGNVQQWPWNGANCQQWRLQSNGDGYFRIISRQSDQSLDVPFCSSDNGANVQQWPYLGSDCQLWKFEQVGDVFTPDTENQCLQVSPNPASTSIRIHKRFERTTPVEVEWIDKYIGVVLKQTIQVPAGAKGIDLDTSSLPDGLYYLRVTYNQKQQTSRVVIQK
ncbi:MAG: RICIN domain-containing protein [Bacteroidota bacterium]